MLVGIHEAKTHLSKLIPAVLAGEEVIITKAGQPLVKLVPVQQERKSRPLGMFKNKIILHDDLSAPLPRDVLDAFWPEKL
ncbi:MAG: type II toxin-antitoxin system prevent-host-death family antitoxin [Pseudomonadota bacterium]